MMNVLRNFRSLSVSVSQVYGFEVRDYCSQVAANDMKWWQKILHFRSRPQVAVIPVRGTIMSSPNNVQSGKYVNSISMRSLLERAEKVRNLKAIVLEINSPGGSPVQSDIIRNEIRRTAAKKKVPVYAFVEDMAASGGYYVACAADKIFVNKHSVIGSIGVLYATFGLNRFIARYDIDRRVITAGKNKLANDIFQEESKESRAKMERLLGSIHEGFTAVVRDARGSRLKEDEEALFEGDIWTAKRALQLGLADEMYDSTEITLHNLFGPLVVPQRFRVKTSFRDRLSAFDDGFTPSLSEDERALKHLIEFFGSSALNFSPKC